MVAKLAQNGNFFCQIQCHMAKMGSLAFVTWLGFYVKLWCQINHLKDYKINVNIYFVNRYCKEKQHTCFN